MLVTLLFELVHQNEQIFSQVNWFILFIGTKKDSIILINEFKQESHIFEEPPMPVKNLYF